MILHTSTPPPLKGQKERSFQSYQRNFRKNLQIHSTILFCIHDALYAIATSIQFYGIDNVWRQKKGRM